MNVKNPTEQNRPLRVIEKALHGGLGAGNLGVCMSTHGTGKLAVLTSFGLDKAMSGKNVLHVAMGKSISGVRAYRDGLLSEIQGSLDLKERSDLLTEVERHTQIYTYRTGQFSIPKLAQTLDFLSDHAEFRPEMIEIEGWPEWKSIDPDEIRTLKRFAVAAKCEIWMAVHTQASDACDERGVPNYLRGMEDQLSVIIALDAAKDHTRLRFVKVHGSPGPNNTHLEFDPSTMLIRWR